MAGWVFERLTLAVLSVPSQVVAGEGQRLAEVGLHGAVDGEAYHMVKQVITNGPYDVRRPDDVPLGAGLLAVRVEGVFLRVVEIALERDARVGLERWVRSRADVEAVLLGPRLQQEALGREAGVLEALCEVDDQVGWEPPLSATVW